MLKKNYCIILLVVFACVSTQAQDFFISNTQNRDFVSLNGKWKYVLDPYQTGGMGGMPVYKNYIPKDKSDRVEYGFDKGKTLWVPGSWNTQLPELTYFEGNIWYRRTFDKEDLS